MKYFYKNNKEPDLCLVFCGWGTDEYLYMPVLNDMDYLLYYDYDKELQFSIPIDISSYNDIYLLAYSAGGFMPAVLKDKLPNIKKSVSVNSSVELFGKYGLNDDFLKITKELNNSNYLDFRKKYMTETDEEFNLFNENQPHRSFQSCFDELDNLRYLAKQYKNIFYNYDKAFSSKNDKILPNKYQKEYFGEKLVTIEGGHFPFYKYDSLKYFLTENAY